MILLKNGLRIASVSKDKTIKLWDCRDLYDKIQNDFSNSQDFSTIKPKSLKSSIVTEIAHDEEINFIRVSHNEKLLATGSYDKLVKIWEVSKSGDSIKLINELRGHTRSISDLSFSLYAKVAVTSSSDKTIKIWNLNNGSCINTFSGHLSSVLRVHWVYYGTHILSFGSDGLIKLWNVKTSENINTIDAHEGKIWAADLIQNKLQLDFITGGSDSNVHLFTDCTAEKEIEEMKKEDMIKMKEEELMHFKYNKSYLEVMKMSLELNHKRDFMSNFKLYIENLTQLENDPIEIILNNNKEFQELENLDEKDIQSKIKLDWNRIYDDMRSMVYEYSDLMLEVIRDYNIKPSSFIYCQVLLKVVLSLIDYKKFLGKQKKIHLRNVKGKGKGNTNTKDGLEITNDNKKKVNLDYMENFSIINSFTEKHVDRINRELTNNYLLDMVVDSMQLVPNK